MFDIASTRLAATQMHPPGIVFVVLALISLVCGFLVGYEMGATELPSRVHMIVLALIPVPSVIRNFGKEGSGPQLALAIPFVLIMGWFGISSFWRARKISKS